MLCYFFLFNNIFVHRSEKKAQNKIVSKVRRDTAIIILTSKKKKMFSHSFVLFIWMWYMSTDYTYNIINLLVFYLFLATATVMFFVIFPLGWLRKRVRRVFVIMIYNNNWIERQILWKLSKNSLRNCQKCYLPLQTTRKFNVFQINGTAIQHKPVNYHRFLFVIRVRKAFSKS